MVYEIYPSKTFFKRYFHVNQLSLLLQSADIVVAVVIWGMQKVESRIYVTLL